MKIAIAGKMASGKSSCAKHLQEINPQFRKFSFASKVKELATDLFHQESMQDGMHENALEKLIHQDFFNNFRDDFDDTDLS